LLGCSNIIYCRADFSDFWPLDIVRHKESTEKVFATCRFADANTSIFGFARDLSACAPRIAVTNVTKSKRFKESVRNKKSGGHFLRIGSKLGVSLLCAASVVALSSAARAQSADPIATESVVVTGSRIITNSANSPTPLTVITTEQMQATTPSSVPDALNKLPVFQGSKSTRSNNNASQNDAGNTLNLRNFGANRTLVLFDGHRVSPTNADGTVDVDTLPQMLMQRVDVVTGGASAVYGSDAVTGVVNFVLDKKFSGVKFNVNSGISSYGDAASYQAGVAAGTDVLGGRGHVEGSLRHFHSDGINDETSRPEGRNVWLLTGAGTAANPFVDTPHAALTAYSFGGKITCTNCGTLNNAQFVQNGVVGPFNAGTPTGTNGVNSGGDGAHTTVSMATVFLNTDEAFGRFGYDLDDTTSVYVQASAAQSSDKGPFQNNNVYTGTAPNTFLSSNPFLPASVSAQMNNPTFNLAEYITAPGVVGFQTNALNSNMQVTAGADGTVWDKYKWDVFYTHGQSRLKVDDPTNQNNAKMTAAEDAVVGPDGKIACYVSTTASANLYPGCVPLNPFGPTAVTQDAWKYFTQDTYFISTNSLDDVGGSVSGEIFEGWAGPIKAAVSAEMRWSSLTIVSNALPTQFVDCTGLRTTAPGSTAPLCNTSTKSPTPLWQGNVAANLATVSNNVWEFAGEVGVPLVKDVPLIQSLTMDVAGRYTDYSTSGVAQTWKIGLDWHINDDLRVRGTNSVDIRAPTLSDLFASRQLTHVGYNDQHTNLNSVTLTATQGNPALVPEVARTYTAGIVFTPSIVPGLTASVDYYKIQLKNAITTISPVSTITQGICESSGGTSPFCALYMRPGPFSDHSQTNYPSEIDSETLNAAVNRTEGWDIELDYAFDPKSIIESLPGSVNLRMLANIQPVLSTLSFPGAPLTLSAISKGHVTSFVTYALDDWQFSLQDRWLSGFPRATQFGQVYTAPRGKSVNYVDINIDRKFLVDDAVLDGYLSVQNIANTRPPIVPTNQANPGIYFLGIQGSSVGYDVVGTYFTIGIRANL
jgi:iron complex outermembrane receptor protein